MEEIVTYLLKSSGLLATFFLAYHFLLRKETFFTSNRWFLLSGLGTSILLPLFFIKKIVYVESPKITLPISPENNDLPIIIDKATPITTESIDLLQILFIVYGIVATILIIKVIIDLFSLVKLLRKQTIQKQEELSYININQNIAPFSFFNYIVFNSSLYSQEELESILLHEKIHSQEKHSVDILVAKLFTIIFWFNPLIWFYQKAIIQNLEYIADSKAIQNIEDKKCYQMALLKVVSHQNCLPITNHFYQSLIKKRIIMLNKNQSNKRNLWKYSLILPVLSTFMLLFQVETVAQVKEEESYSISTNFSSTITKNTTDQELKEIEKTFSNKNRKLTISDVNRNKKGEINEIKLLFDTGKNYHRVLHRRSNKSIDDIQIFVKTDDKGIENCDFIETDDKLKALMESSNEEDFVVLATQPSYIFTNEDSFSHRESINKKIVNKNSKATFYFDDKEISKNEALKIKGNLIVEIFEISPNSSSINKYGEKGKNGVVLINSKVLQKNPVELHFSKNEANKFSENKNVEDNQEKNNYTVTRRHSETGELIPFEKVKKNERVDYKKAMFIYDGKEINGEDFEKIDASIIAKISVLKSENAIEKYGEKGKNGVIEIKSDKYLEKTDPIYKEITNNNKENKKPKVIIFSNDNGDDIVFIPTEKILKLPGYPSARLNDGELVLIVNGVEKTNPLETLNQMNLQNVKSIRVYDESGKETPGTQIKKIIITTK
jgi:beta-lactamase regulating signal transducer with metallopeptidase domain